MAKLNRRLAEQQIAVVSRFYERLSVAEVEDADQFRELRNSGYDEEMLAEDVALFRDLNQLGDELAILGLHRVAETRIKSMLALHYGPSKAMSLYRWDRLKQALAADFGVVLGSLPGHDAVNELRLLANSIKHNDGRSSPALADEAPQWGTEGEPLRSLADHFTRLADAIPEFVEGLGVLNRILPDK